MSHIDAGTIHAWIDGALDATQSREIEAHVAECSVCAAAVAEERGMVAGASRILLALDDVPAGVTPKHAPARAPVAPRRLWRAAPWVTGIAAALILAVGVTTWRRDDVQREMSGARDEGKAPAALPPPAPPAMQSRSDTLSASSPGGTAASGPASAQKLSRQSNAQPPRTRITTSSERKPETLPTTESQPTTGRVAGSAGAAAPSAAPTTPSVAQRRRLSSDVRLDEVAVTSVRESTTVNRSEILRVEELAGCYAIKPPATGKGVARGVAAAAEVAANAPSKRAAASAQAPTASRADFGVAAVGSPPAVVRLDTARKRPGYAVLAATSDSLIGFWNVTGDSAMADLLMRGIFPISQRNRVDCPER